MILLTETHVSRYVSAMETQVLATLPLPEFCFSSSDISEGVKWDLNTYLENKLYQGGRGEGGGKSHLSSLPENKFYLMVKWFLLFFSLEIFEANSDLNTIVKHTMNNPVQARYIRFYPVTFSGYPCMRIEVFVQWLRKSTTGQFFCMNPS